MKIWRGLFFLVGFVFMANAHQIVDLNDALEQADSETNVVFDIDGVLIRMMDNCSLIEGSNSAVQAAKEKCKSVRCLTKTGIQEGDPQVLLQTLRSYGINLDPIVDSNVLQKLEDIGATHVEGIVYAGPESKGKVLATIFNEDDTIVFVDDSVGHVESALKECPQCKPFHFISER